MRLRHVITAARRVLPRSVTAWPVLVLLSAFSCSDVLGPVSNGRPHVLVRIGTQALPARVRIDSARVIEVSSDTLWIRGDDRTYRQRIAYDLWMGDDGSAPIAVRPAVRSGARPYHEEWGDDVAAVFPGFADDTVWARRAYAFRPRPDTLAIYYGQLPAPAAGQAIWQYVPVRDASARR